MKWLDIFTLGASALYRFATKVNKIENDFESYKEFSTKQKDRIEKKVDKLYDKVDEKHEKLHKKIDDNFKEQTKIILNILKEKK